MSFPGAAVWHVPWTDKNDGVDWQSYFHHRNRIIAALLHSPYERGGRMVRESLNHQIKHLASLQYSTAELRHLAMEDVLRGPARAARRARRRSWPEINAFRKQFADAQLHADRDELPPVRRKKPPKKGKSDIEIPGRLGHADRRPASRRCASCARCGRWRGLPRGRAHRDGRRLVQPRRSTTPPWSR